MNQIKNLKRKDTTKNLCEQIQVQIKCLEAEINQKENQGEVPFFEYEKVAVQINKLKSEAVNYIRTEYLKNNESAKLKGIDYLLELVHPFPLNTEILELELNLLEELRLLSQSLKDNKNRKRIERYLDDIEQNIAFQKYNHASLFSKMASERIVELILGREEDEIEEIDEKSETIFQWSVVFDLLKQSIDKFKEVRKIYQEQNEEYNTCNIAIATGYEKLADCYYDQAKESTNKIDILLKALKYYQKVKQLRTTNLREIDLSILNVLHELASSYKEKNIIDQFLKYNSDIRSQLEEFPQEYYKTRPELVFYDLDTLAETYKVNQKTSIKKNAIANIKYYQNQLTEISQIERQLEIYNYLEYYSPIFNLTLGSAKNITFSMAPLSDPEVKLKRQQQFLAGLDKIIRSNFATEHKITLRSHQIIAFQKWHQFAKNQNSGYFCLPTGAGKTIIMILALLSISMPVLFIVSTTILIDQTMDNIKKLVPKIQISRFDGLAKQKFLGQILVTTYDSLQLDVKKEQPYLNLQEFGFVLADECHRSLTQPAAEIINRLKETSYVFGFTATDYYNTHRNKGAFSSADEVFGEQVYDISLSELIEAKQLSGVKNIFVHGIQISSKSILRYKNEESDYTNKELSILINQDLVADSAIDIYLNEFDPYNGKVFFGQSALFFCFGIEHANTLCTNLNNRAVGKWNSEYPLAICVHSGISHKIRKESIKLHKEGKIPVLVGDKVFSVGYDNEQERFGFLLRPTRSLVYAKQRAGRLIRSAPGKEFATIIEWNYNGLEQTFFKDFVNGEHWVGVNVPMGNFEKRQTIGYQIQWHKNDIIKSNNSNNNSNSNSNSNNNDNHPNNINYNNYYISNNYYNNNDIYTNNYFDDIMYPTNLPEFPDITNEELDKLFN